MVVPVAGPGPMLDACCEVLIILILTLSPSLTFLGALGILASGHYLRSLGTARVRRHLASLFRGALDEHVLVLRSRQDANHFSWILWDVLERG